MTIGVIPTGVRKMTINEEGFAWGFNIFQIDINEFFVRFNIYESTGPENLASIYLLVQRT